MHPPVAAYACPADASRVKPSRAEARSRDAHARPLSPSTARGLAVSAISTALARPLPPSAARGLAVSALSTAHASPPHSAARSLAVTAVSTAHYHIRALHSRKSTSERVNEREIERERYAEIYVLQSWIIQAHIIHTFICPSLRSLYVCGGADSIPSSSFFLL